MAILLKNPEEHEPPESNQVEICWLSDKPDSHKNSPRILRMYGGGSGYAMPMFDETIKA